jgi:hypothetical protein
VKDIGAERKEIRIETHISQHTDRERKAQIVLKRDRDN